MFEQSFVIDGGTARKRWTMMASVTGQVIAVAIAMLIPLAYTDKLPRAILLTTTLFAPPLRPPPPGRQVERRAAVDSITPQPTFRLREFVQPSRIPAVTPPLVDAPEYAPTAATTTAIGRFANGIPGGLELGQTIAPPPPKPVMAKVEPPVKPTGPVRVGGNVLAAKIITRVVPPYPPIAKAARISGTVHLLGVIAKDGTIQKLQVISGHPLLVQAALDAVRQWTYRPTYLNNEVVEVMAPIEVNFTLAQ